MELYALHQIVLGIFDNLQVATLQGVIKGHGRGMTAYDCYSLNALRLIAVNRLFCDGVNARHKLNIHRAVRFGRYGFIHSVARDIELNARNNTVLGSLFNMTCAVGFGVDFEIEIYRVGSTRNHSLFAYAAPDEHIVGIEINLLLCGYRYGRGNHFVARKGVFVTASGYGNTACRKLDIGERIVGVLNRQAVFLGIGIVFQRIGVCLALVSCRKARNGIMVCHLRQNPVIAFLGRSALDRGIVHIRRNAVCTMQVGRTCTELLLIFPDNRLRCISVIVGVCSCYGRRFTLVPAVHQSHHNAELCVGRQVFEIGAVLTAFRGVGVARIEINTRLHAVNLVRSAVIGHQIFSLGVTRTV